MKSLEHSIRNCIDHISTSVENCDVRGATDAPVSDVLERLRVNVKRESSQSTIHKMFLRMLGHIPVNPSRVENSHFLNSSYVYPDLDEKLAADFVNSSPSAADRFLERLVGMAKREQVRSVEGRLPKVVPYGLSKTGDRVLCLKAARGAGKTFFLNHLFTRSSDKLDSDSTIWVRINLISDRGYDDDIEAWTRAQIAKILLRYYDEKSGYRVPKKDLTFPFSMALKEWVEKEADVGDELRQELRSDLLEMEQAFVLRGSDVDINPRNVNDRIATALFRIARELGLSFIIVFDGFDRLDHDQRNTARFKRIAESLIPFLYGTARFGAAFLLVTRSETFKWLSSQPMWEHAADRTFSIAAPGVADIAIKRLDSFVGWPVLESETRNNLHGEVCNLALNFKSYLIDRFNAGELSEIDQTLSGNCRAKIQMIELIFARFIQDRSGQGYRVLELFVKAGYNHPPLFYKHMIDGGAIKTDVASATSFDSRFLPVLTRPSIPTNSKGEYISSYYSGLSSILHGARILQLLNIAKRGLLDGQLSVGDACAMLSKWFGYDHTVTRAMIYDYESFEVVSVARDRDTYDDSDHSRIALMPKGELLIERILLDPAYLNLCAMRTIIPSHAHAHHPFSVATLSGDEMDRGASVRHWTRTKIRNAAILSGLMIGINRAQKVAFQARSRVADRYSDERKLEETNQLAYLFDRIERLSWELPRSISSAASGAYLDGEDLASDFERIQKHWSIAHLL